MNGGSFLEGNLFFEKINYRNIYAHKDWDGVIGGGLILRVFELPITFLNRVSEATESIIVEVPFSPEAYIEKCLIIDHHDCKKSYLRSLHFGNHVLCDESYSSVASLITDLFDLDAPGEILSALDYIEEGKIYNDTLAYKMFISFVSNIVSFPFIELTNYVKLGKWNRVISWVENKYLSKEAKLVIRMSKRKLKHSVEIIKDVELITYNTNDALDIGAARLALIDLEKKVKIGVILGLDDVYVRYGIIATLRKKINLVPLFKELSQLSWQIGGRSNVGGFQITHRITLNQAIDILRQALIRREKEINL